ncbi:MAG: formylglycine-generating enzyme family protein [Nonlabens sp.]|uniref:formylglycine-generating enzyme family protein n=1 Tax=Nonlabens sp. TaxID=1888209 RepID=UPI003EF75F68
MFKSYKFLILLAALSVLSSCNSKDKKEEIPTVPVEKKESYQLLVEKPQDIVVPAGMIWVPGKEFIQGAKDNDPMAMPREQPGHKVLVDGFFMDATEVTNDQFSKFVDATQYITVAERPIDWEEMKKELPEGTPKPPDEVLQPGSLIFNKEVNAVVNMDNYTQWWTWKTGANWRQPYGPGSSIKGKENFPAVHVAYEDALAYCKWANRKLPTEAQWESAAQGTQTNQIFTWGNDRNLLSQQSNTWEGTFPTENTGIDGFKFIAPVKSYPANDLGFYDMAGNVWEWTADIYNHDYYRQLDTSKPVINPMGATSYYNPQNPYQVEMIMKGGSYLCHASYCASYRVSARMSTSKDSGSDHLGFRTIATVDMLKE